MATASSRGWAYYYKIRTCNDHMDTLKLYTDYKSYWNKHRIPGETKVNEILWEDPWWKINSPFKRPRRLPPLNGSKGKKGKEPIIAKSEVKEEKTKKFKSLAQNDVKDLKESSSYSIVPSNHETLPAIKKIERRTSNSSSSSED